MSGIEISFLVSPIRIPRAPVYSSTIYGDKSLHLALSLKIGAILHVSFFCLISFSSMTHVSSDSQYIHIAQ